MKHFSKYYVNKLFSNVLLVSCTSPNSFHDFIFTIRKKKNYSIPSSGRFIFFPKKKSLALSNKINIFHSKYYCKFVWKYYRVIEKKKQFRLAVKLEIALALSIIKLNEISRYQIASRDFFFFFLIGSKKDLVWL